MAAGSLLALLDDIASVMDDVALMTKMAGKKTAGVLGDDIALNAQQVSGAVSDRELPVIWAVAKGSFRNKLILVPAALAISALVPAAITPLLMVGGLYLCYEGTEKVLHSLLHPAKHGEVASGAGAGAKAATAKPSAAALDTPLPSVEMRLPAAAEQEKIKGAIRTDFILSAEIIAIALGTVAGADFLTQVLVVSLIALVMTVGVYGFVAAIVRMDDFGLALASRPGVAAASAGRALVAFTPYVMKGLSVVGTAAMFLVGGGILIHGLPRLESWFDQWAPDGHPHAGLLDAIVGGVAPMLFNAAVGAAAGLAVLGVVKLVGRMRGRGQS